MKCTVRDVIEANAALSAHGGMSLPPALSMRFARMTRAIRAEAETAGEVREKLVAEHLLIVDGKPVEIVLPNGVRDREVKDKAAFKAALRAFLDASAEIPGDPFKLSELGAGPIHSDITTALHFAIVDG